MTALTNTSITIQCPTSGVPTPTVTWTKDGQKIASEGRYKIQDDGSLLISESDEEDNARYTCTADSVAGKNKASSTVQVVGKLNSMVYGEIMRADMNRQLVISIKRKVLIYMCKLQMERDRKPNLIVGHLWIIKRNPVLSTRQLDRHESTSRTYAKQNVSL